MMTQRMAMATSVTAPEPTYLATLVGVAPVVVPRQARCRRPLADRRSRCACAHSCCNARSPRSTTRAPPSLAGRLLDLHHSQSADSMYDAMRGGTDDSAHRQRSHRRPAAHAVHMHRSAGDRATRLTV